jgi:hypothetical protein
MRRAAVAATVSQLIAGGLLWGVLMDTESALLSWTNAPYFWPAIVAWMFSWNCWFIAKGHRAVRWWPLALVGASVPATIMPLMSVGDASSWLGGPWLGWPLFVVWLNVNLFWPAWCGLVTGEVVRQWRARSLSTGRTP